jgi:hypothetical protein
MAWLQADIRFFWLNVYYTDRSESRCALIKTCSSIERTIVSKTWIKQLHTLPVLHFSCCLTTEYSETTAHCNGNFDTVNRNYVPWPKCIATFRKHCRTTRCSLWGFEWTVTFNLWKPKTYLIYHQHSTILCSAHNAFMCFAWISEQTAIISLYLSFLSIFITEAESVFCALRTESLTKTDAISSSKG